MTKQKKPKFTLMRACMIVEGEEDPSYPEEYLDAWQWLIDSGQVWKLQGWYGRTASMLISDGTCTAPITKEQEG